MNDNALIKALRDVLLTGLSKNGQADVDVQQAYQPTQQGANSSKSVYFFKVSDSRYGFGARQYSYGTIDSTLTESQLYITTFQIQAWVRQIPMLAVDYSLLTASDLVNLCARILLSQSALDAFNANNIGVLRITDVRNPFFIDDRGQFEASPSFDVQLTSKTDTTSQIPSTTEVAAGIYPI